MLVDPPPRTPLAATPPVRLPAAGGVLPPAGGDYYSQLLASDPQLQAALASIQGLQGGYQGAFQNNIQQLLEQYGEIPQGLPAGLDGIVSQSVRDLANQATGGGVSTVAQIAKAFQDRQRTTLNGLAAHGLLGSGDLGYQQGQNLQSENQARYNALQTLLGSIGNAQQGLLGQQQTLAGQQETATNDALARIYAQIQAGTIAGPGTPTAAAGTAGTAAAGAAAGTAAPKAAPGRAAATPVYRGLGDFPTSTPARAPLSVAVKANPTGASSRGGSVFAIH